MRVDKPAGDGRAILSRGIAAALLFALWVVLASANSRGLEVKHIEVTVHDLPEALAGLRIAQVSDVHSSRLGDGQRELLDAITAFGPDLIAVTGDFIDGVNPDEVPCLELAQSLTAIAPVYYVRGNHEYYLDSDERAHFEADLQSAGFVLLDNLTLTLTRNGQPFLLTGMDDVTRRAGNLRAKEIGYQEIAMETAVDFMQIISDKMPQGDVPLKIMLCHQPHYWALWEAGGYDLALCGHLHGWLARLPGYGCVFSNPSRYFPEEDAGLYDKGNLQVYISRGLDSLTTWRNIRLNNKPQLDLIEIK